MSTFRPSSPPRPSADDDGSVLDIASDGAHYATSLQPLTHSQPDEERAAHADGLAEPESFVPAFTPEPKPPLLRVNTEGTLHDDPLQFSTAGMLESPAEELALDAHGDPGPSTIAARAHVYPGQLSPQPWDLIPPPAHNNLPGTYSTAVTKALSGMGADMGDDRTSRRLIPKSSYYFGPPPPGSVYGSDPIGQIGVHHPREVVRVERDYSGGELIQFSSVYPLELEGRLSTTQFLETINSINEVLISAHSLRWAFMDNFLEVASLQLSRLVIRSHYEREMERLKQVIRLLNLELYNPAGLNILWPRKVAFMFLEIEYY